MKRVMVFGTFDLLHRGHLDLFKQARCWGDYLIAVIACDQNVERVKGRPPVHTESERKELLDHIDLIDDAIIGNPDDVYEVIRVYKPAIIALGYDQSHFVKGLDAFLLQEKLDTKVVRLESYAQDRCKSSLLKEESFNDYIV